MTLEQTETSTNEFFNRFRKLINRNTKKVITEQKSLNINKYFNQFVDDVLDKKINVHNDFETFKNESTFKLTFIRKEIFDKLFDWLTERLNQYFNQLLINLYDEEDESRIKQKIRRIFFIRILFDDSIYAKLIN